MRADYLYSHGGGARQLRRLYNDALESFVARNGPEAPEVVPIYAQLGKIDLVTDKYKNAITYFDKALPLARKGSRLDTELSIRTLLVEALDRSGNEARCIDEVEALAIRMGEGDRSEAAPLVRHSPKYPSTAAERGIEGWVHFRFGIDAQGHVVDPVVEKAEPPGHFEASALEAFSKWRYAPKVEDGKTVASDGYQMVLTYDLAN